MSGNDPQSVIRPESSAWSREKSLSMHKVKVPLVDKACLSSPCLLLASLNSPECWDIAMAASGQPRRYPHVPGFSPCRKLGLGISETGSPLFLSPVGRVFAWGMGTNYQLGTDRTKTPGSPVEMTGKQLENRVVLTVSSGGQHTVLLVKDKKQSW